jgi:transposase
MVLEGLKGANRRELAERYGVTEDYVYRALREARERAETELSYWREGSGLLGGVPGEAGGERSGA